MRFSIDPLSGEPPFAQLRQQVLDRVGDGTLAPGDRLPPVRNLATELGIAANTVARAYRELEADGVLEGRGRTGTFVRATVTDGRIALAAASARAAAERYAETTRSLGLSPEQALAVVRQALEA
ncbi:GntR family transcriptional regulator [Ornithinimicrobium humiphilum]|uniref:DNA-binding transcriptional regulator YhcF (GntR family) n=1 Tax=Ornithinimicrobium humiphilum TaxID=125288 RepID=A0A543KMP1_9MICO|nr:GntR family transcriptional regulator [Ornithinimicrobium humiphilum]TQM96343.1 DNA-binding transcriptional regulator YhcF (GntR family) [Ornithinimicrobium humiphilum]